MKIVEASFK